jgi:hypothetical protein
VYNNTYYGIEKSMPDEWVEEHNGIFNNPILGVVQARGYYNIVFKEETLCIIDMDNPVNFNKDEYKHILQKIRDNKLNFLI